MNAPQNLIGNDGSLALRIPAADVTWFQLLQLGRAATSENGGWNSKKYWTTRGLNVLHHEGVTQAFVEQWTANSLRDREPNPVPRISDFMISQRHSALDQGVRGKSGSPKIGTENSLNWELSKSIRATIAQEKMTQRISTYELPLCDESSGQLKADVVVFNPKARFVEIVELKREGASDSPMTAMVEGICYAIQLIRCWHSLNSELRELSPSIRLGELIKEINIVIAAPKYWESWASKRDGSLGFSKGDASGLASIAKRVGSVIKSERKLGDFSLTLTFAEISPDGTGGLRALPLWGEGFSKHSVFAEGASRTSLARPR